MKSTMAPWSLELQNVQKKNVPYSKYIILEFVIN